MSEYLFNRNQGAVIMALATVEAPFMPAAELFDALDHLPGHTEFDIETQTFTSTGDIREERFRLMARDMPRIGRRYTCLTTGFEWMDLRAIATSNEWRAVVIYHPKTGATVASALID